MFYDANRISGLGSINVEPDARFCHEHAAMQAVIESQQNELIMFENNLAVDFQEAAMIHEGAYAEDIEALHENVFTDIFKRIKDLFMKLWAKIKSIFKVFIAKFDSIFMKSSKEFIKKYKKDVLSKDLTDVTVNYSKPKGVDFVISKILSVNITKADISGGQDTIQKALEDLSKYDSTYKNYADSVKNTYFEIEDLESEISSKYNHLEFDEDRLDQINERVNFLKNLMRKYNMDIIDLISYQKKLETFQIYTCIYIRNSVECKTCCESNNENDL